VTGVRRVSVGYVVGNGKSDAGRAPYPVVWALLALPFGVTNGFVGVALTFVATQHGLSITQGAVLHGAKVMVSWLKWAWAPLVDTTLSPRRWYLLGTFATAAGLCAMAATPLRTDMLGILVAVIAATGVVSSVVAMAVEALMACSARGRGEEVGRVGAWYQAGNFAGAGVGGALGLALLRILPRPWMAGVVIGAIVLSCCVVVGAAPEVERTRRDASPPEAVRGVIRDLRAMLTSKNGVLAAVLCFSPVGTGAASIVLSQAKVAAYWGAGAAHVEALQGAVGVVLIGVGCFVGGSLCRRVAARTAYAGVGVAMAAITAAMAASPASVGAYLVWTAAYMFAVGLTAATFTAFVLEALGAGSAATKFNVLASLANFPFWWVGLVLGGVADAWGPRAMLLVESVVGVLGVFAFFAVDRVIARVGYPRSR
jgi:MFS family permease